MKVNINNKERILTSPSTNVYRKEMLDALKLSFPGMFESELKEAIEYSIKKRSKDTSVKLDNNYEKREQDTTLFAVYDYIMKREPIITVSGVMFKKHGTCPNPFVDLIQEFLTSRGVYKKEMFKYFDMKDFENYEKYNILQNSEKKSGNSMYGASGNNTSIFYNLYSAQSITMQGRSCIASAILLFEATLANNVKFTNLNDLVTFINNVRREERINYPEETILDENITVEECFYKIMYSSGFYWIPTKKDMIIVWDILNQMTQSEINKLFYKNNLYWFVENKVVMNTIINILSKLETPFLDPNEPPKEIEDLMNNLYEMIKEWVYYDKQYLDRNDRSENMLRCVSVLTDTDSCFISFDAWYRFILDKTFDIPMKIKELEVNENTGEITPSFEKRYDYNFYTDEIIELEREIRPDIIGPSVCYRCSIINILASIMGRLSIDYMNKYSDNSNSTTCYDGSKRTSYFILKNEFQLKRALVTDSKKFYCSYQERKESSIIPKEKAMDIKGMTIAKVGLPEITKKRLKDIIFDYILNAGDNINQIDIIKQLAIFEKQIRESIMSGNKEFFKPARIKGKDSYSNPMSQSGIKASVAYNNIIKDTGKELIDLDTRNSIIIIDVNINKTNCEKIKDSYPEIYNNIIALLDTPEFSDGINKIAILENEDTPEWIKEFINYTKIVNINLTPFPCETIGITRKDKPSINYTNIISF